MSQITYRGNLSARAFPLIAEHFGRTVIVGGQDQNFNRQVQSDADIDKDRGIPQVYYCHNTMPTAEGWQSIGYKDRYAASAGPGVTNFKAIYVDGSAVPLLIAHTATGDNYVCSVFNFHVWTKINTIPGDVGFTEISTAYVNGQMYFCFSGLGVYYFDNATQLLTKVTLIGITEADVTGITGASGYLIAHTYNYVGWSTAIAHLLIGDPFDFTPSLLTGAGGGQIDAARGGITVCIKHSQGFIIYTTANAVGAMYSGNARYPFNFKEIMGVGGVEDRNLISSGSESRNHYAYTSSGLQLVSMSDAVLVMSEISDFLSGKYFEDFDDATKTFTHNIVTTRLSKGLTVISDRYLVISYGRFINDVVSKFTHALIYDLAQKRFGKIKVEHEAVFDFSLEGLSVAESSEAVRESLGIFYRSGLIRTVDFTVGSATSNGTLLLGKYQYMRQRLLTLDGIELENVFPASTFSVSNLLAVDGKNTVVMPVVAKTPDGNLRAYNCRQTGINHSILIQGNFFLSSILLTFHMNGRR